MFWEKKNVLLPKARNQPASDSGNNVLEVESGRPMMGPTHEAFIKTTTVVVAFT
jgi:hypothetical protein